MMEQLIQQVLVEMREMRGEVKELKQDVKGLKVDVTGLKEEQRKTSERLGIVEKELGAVKNETSTMAKKIDSMECEFRVTRHKIDGIDYKLDVVYNQTANLTEFRTESRQEFSDIRATLKYIVKKSVDTEKELYLIRDAR